MTGNEQLLSESHLIQDGHLLFELLSESCDDYLFMHDREHEVFRISEKFLEEFDLPGSILRNSDQFWLKLVHPNDRAVFAKSMLALDKGNTDIHDLEYRLKNKQGEYVWIRCHGKALREAEGNIPLFAGIVTILGRQRKVDNITGLMNKHQFESDIKSMLTHRKDAFGAVMILGLDNFKNINETYNRMFGDSVLKAVGKKLEEILPLYAKLYRLDGDEFGVLYENAQRKDMEEIFKNIKRYTNRQQEVEHNKYFCTISGGCVLFPQDGSSYLSLHKHTEATLELAKRSGKNNLCFFSKSAHFELVQGIEMMEALRKSVENDFEGFELYFQAQVNAEDCTLKGAEALLRWRSPMTGAIVSPATFIPLLEESKLILSVGNWVLCEAVRTCKVWCESLPDFKMSVNVSYVQFKEDVFKTFVVDCIEAAGVSPSSIVLELTESCIAADLDFLNKEFGFLRKKGIVIAMDDFGTGYSSLSFLKNLSTDIVKIDREFVRQILYSTFDQMLVEYTIKLCHSIGLEVCIEGTEMKEEYRMIKSLAPDFIQGYLFGRPETQAEFNRKFILNQENLQVPV